ncbi:MAG TPA: hypothetical protein VG603_09225 [Chitinophagales bacterium]|nr:hypothetical protein [Chitinophagales bacterium]
MGKRKITVKKQAAESIAQIAWFIESKGLLATAENFSDEAYNFLESLADERRTFMLCRNEERNMLGLKCVNYKKKFTVVFIEAENELIICEFLPSKILR